jgi:hypothetical protein
MHVHIGALEFLVFALYYVILKLIIHFINIESRRSGSHVLSGVSGLLA